MDTQPEQYELRKLCSDWLPWRWQINRYEAIGNEDGKPNLASQINYENYEDAAQYFVKLLSQQI